jgi:transcriptional regulator with XRE-family HTH domain
MIIGDRIRQLREQKGITRGEIEQFSGLDQSYLARIEQGRTVPPLETLERIAAALAVPLYWLFYAEEDPALAPPVVAAACQRPAEWRFTAELQLERRLQEVSGDPFEVDPAFLVDFARKMLLGKPEN